MKRRGGTRAPQRTGPPRTLAQVQEELDSLVGLGSVKEQVRTLLAFLQVQARRREHGLTDVSVSQHLVFLATRARARRPWPACSPRPTAPWGC